jgi:hypothetical protein
MWLVKKTSFPNIYESLYDQFFPLSRRRKKRRRREEEERRRKVQMKRKRRRREAVRTTGRGDSQGV